jgi:trehalose 6-phosphate synthase complex regulatory subunit
MSSFRNHRIVIASLFLPSTAVLGDSVPPTPDNHDKDPALAMVPNAFPTVGEIAPEYHPAINHHTRNPSSSAPLKSIVEDLKDKVC